MRVSRHRFSAHCASRAAVERPRLNGEGRAREETCLHAKKPKRNLDWLCRPTQNCQTYFCGLVPIEAEMDGAKLDTSQWVYVEFCWGK